MFAIISFKNTNYFEIVPKIWLTNDSHYVHFPTFVGDTYIKAVKKQMKPLTAEWERFEINLIKLKDTYEKSDKALKRLIADGENANLSTTADDTANNRVLSKRARSGPQRYIHESHSLSPPPVKKHYRQQATTSNTLPKAPAKISAPISFNHFDDFVGQPLAESSLFVETQPVDLHNEHHIQNEHQHEKYFKTLITLIVKQNEHISRLEQHILDIKKDLADRHIAEPEAVDVSLTGGGGRRKHGAIDKMPIDSIPDFTQWITNTQRSNNFRDSVIRYLRLQGGKTVRSAVGAVCSAIMTDNLAVQFSLRGRKHGGTAKQSAVDCGLAAIVETAVSYSFPKASKTELNAILGEYLKSSTKRLQRRALPLLDAGARQNAADVENLQPARTYNSDSE